MISIIGAGKVGSAIAFLCGSAGLDDITLVNRNEKKAIGEALDISNAIPYDSKISINGTSDYSKIRGSDVIVITASARPHQEKRSDIMLEQALLVRDIAKKTAAFAPDAIILMVTNPVDVMTHLVQKQGNLDSKKVLGIASSLDSSRFRYLLAKEFGTNQSSIHDAMVLGEHDDSMVPIFSQAKFDKTPVTQLLDESQRLQITDGVRNYWKSLRDYKGSSVFGIAKNTFDTIQAIIHDKSMDTCASVLLDGQYGLADVCVGVPVTVNKNGIAQIRQILLADDESQQLHSSAGMVKSNITLVNEFLKSSL
jgi:malate dehydrogenase